MRLDYTITHQHEPPFPVCYDHFSIQEASLFLNPPLHFGKHCLPYIFPLCTPSEYHQHPPKACKNNHSPTYPGLPCNRQSDKAITIKDLNIFDNLKDKVQVMFYEESKWSFLIWNQWSHNSCLACGAMKTEHLSHHPGLAQHKPKQYKAQAILRLE